MPTPTSTPTSPTRLRGRLRILALVLALTAIFTGCDPYTDAQDRTRELINDSRRNHGLRTLPMNLSAANKAQRWAEHLADCRCVQHSNLAAGMPDGWRALGENVGYGRRGGNLVSVHQMFMRSPTHRSNILDRRWNVVGTGVAERANRKYVVHVYAEY